MDIITKTEMNAHETYTPPTSQTESDVPSTSTRSETSEYIPVGGITTTAGVEMSLHLPQCN